MRVFLLEMIDRVVPFERFRAEIEAAVGTPADEKKSNAGRKPIDVIVMFRMLVLQSLYNLSDEQTGRPPTFELSRVGFLGARWQMRCAPRLPIGVQHPTIVIMSYWPRVANVETVTAGFWSTQRSPVIRGPRRICDQGCCASTIACVRD
jgi:Transposase domain (DUF772)